MNREEEIIRSPGYLSIVQKANEVQGCLAHLKTQMGHYRYSEKHRAYEDPLAVPNCFKSDLAKLLMSKAVRNLPFKTQVFSYADNSMVRNRRSHTDEVSAISIIVGEMLGLNTSLIEAATLGHDTGHVPLGHAGEHWMAQEMGRPEFCHEVMGPIIAQKIERGGRGHNLAFETMDAMQRHSGNRASADMTPEAWVLRYCDKFAYLFADANDFQRMGYCHFGKELSGLLDDFGQNQRTRVSRAQAELIVESSEMGKVSFEHSEFAQKFARLRKLMYEIYPRIAQQDVSGILGPVLEFLTRLNIGDPFLLLALMTDEEVRIISKTSMKDFSLLTRLGIGEILPHLETIGKIDMCDVGLDWYKTEPVRLETA